MQQHKNMTETNYNPALHTFYDIRPGNGAGLFSKEKEVNKKRKYKQQKKATYKKQKEASDKVTKHTKNDLSMCL